VDKIVSFLLNWSYPNPFLHKLWEIFFLLTKAKEADAPLLPRVVIYRDQNENKEEGEEDEENGQLFLSEWLIVVLCQLGNFVNAHVTLRVI
jgi:hypothetical protein